MTAEDLRVAELSMKSGCATLIALNKWDLARNPNTPGREAEEVGGFDLEDLTARMASGCASGHR